MDENSERYYRALNLEPSASPEEIYQAYRDLARVWDPERFAHSPRLELMAEAKLKEIIDAYRALLPGGAPDGNTAAHASPPRQEREPESPAPLPPDPFAAPAPERPMIADLYRAHEIPVDLPPPPAPRPAVIVAVEPPPSIAPPSPPPQQAAVPVPETQPAPVAPAAAAVAPEAAPQGETAEPIPTSRKIRFAVIGATIALIFGAGIFLYEALSGPPPRRAPEPIPIELPAADNTSGGLKPVVEAAAPAESQTGETAPATKRVRRAAAQPEPARQLPTGTELMTPQGRTGAGKFRIANQSGQDAVARIAAQAAPESALRLIYIQSGTEINIGDIGPGVYFVSFSMGPLTSKPRSFGPRFGPFQFIQIESVSGTQSDQYQIALKPRQ
jgi:hypothetical protein